MSLKVAPSLRMMALTLYFVLAAGLIILLFKLVGINAQLGETGASVQVDLAEAGANGGWATATFLALREVISKMGEVLTGADAAVSTELIAKSMPAPHDQNSEDMRENPS